MQVDIEQTMDLPEDPFSGGFARHPYYISPSLAQRLDLLQHLVEYSHQPIMVLGEEGAGKTRMLDELAQRAEDNWRVAVLDAGQADNDAAVQSVLSAAYGVLIERGDEAEQISTLEAQLQAYARAMLIPVLLLDNAHLLADAALERVLDLMRLGDGDDGGLRVVLFCEPSAAAHINAIVLGRQAQGITHSIDIPALSDDQIDEYLTLYLAEPGGEDETHFSDDEFDLIYRESAGLPGQINVPSEPVAEGLLQAVPRKLLREPRQWLYLLLGALLLSAAATLLWRGWAPDEVGSGVDESRIDLPAPGPDTQPSGAEPIAVADTLAKPAANTGVAPAGVATTTWSDTDTVAASTGRAHSPAAAVAEIKIDPESAHRQLLAASPPDAVAEPVPADTVAVVPTSIVSPGAAKIATPAATGSGIANNSAVPSSSRPAPSAKPEPKAKSIQSTNSDLKGNAWLASLPSGSYVIQLFGSYDKASALSFIHKHRKLKEFALLRTRHKRRDWYVVVHGPYSDKQQALRAIRGLPASVRRLQPWARPVAPLLESVRLAN